MDIKPEYIICLYLAKFSPRSYENLNFSSWTECFNVLADRLGVKPSTLKNHRDTFDAFTLMSEKAIKGSSDRWLSKRSTAMTNERSSSIN